MFMFLCLVKQNFAKFGEIPICKLDFTAVQNVVCTLASRTIGRWTHTFETSWQDASANFPKKKKIFVPPESTVLAGCYCKCSKHPCTLTCPSVSVSTDDADGDIDECNRY